MMSLHLSQKRSHRPGDTIPTILSPGYTSTDTRGTSAPRRLSMPSIVRGMEPTSTAGVEIPSTASLFREFADGVYTLGYRILGDRHLAEDAVQETFIKVMKSLHTYRGDGPLAGWLYRIGYRETIAIARKRRDQPMDADLLGRELEPAVENVERSVVERELADRLDKAIAALTDPLRGAFVLRDIEGLSTTEVAAALEVSESAVKMRLARAREALRVELQEYLL